MLDLQHAQLHIPICMHECDRVDGVLVKEGQSEKKTVLE